jgi:3-methyladenine DNA glycosylase AlkD
LTFYLPVGSLLQFKAGIEKAEEFPDPPNRIRKTENERCSAILKRLRSLGNERNRAGMARFGIETKNVYGISIPDLRKLAKEIGMNHQLALKLWDSGIHEAMLLACFVDDPEKVT